MDQVTVFAPATIGNVGPGFDILGLALEKPGDTVTARRVPGSAGRVRLVEVTGEGDLAKGDEKNTAVVAANGVLQGLEVAWGVDLVLHKGLPIGSGLGSSGASAVAAAKAVNLLAGEPRGDEELVAICARAEQSACGAAHADNVAPALLGGFVLVQPGGALLRLQTDLTLTVALVRPELELKTEVARACLPSAIELSDVSHNLSAVGTLAYGLGAGDVDVLRSVLDDRVAEPHRAHLIPGFFEVKAAAMKSGALWSSISGAGPTLFAVCEDEQRAEQVVAAMSAVLQGRGQAHQAWWCKVAQTGAHVV